MLKSLEKMMCWLSSLFNCLSAVLNRMEQRIGARHPPQSQQSLYGGRDSPPPVGLGERVS